MGRLLWESIPSSRRPDALEFRLADGSADQARRLAKAYSDSEDASKQIRTAENFRSVIKQVPWMSDWGS
jgi:hypothetical protein